MNQNPMYYYLLFLAYPFNHITGICRFLIDLATLTPSVKPNQSPNPSPSPRMPGLDRCFGSEARSTEPGRHWRVSSACRATHEERQGPARAGRERRHVQRDTDSVTHVGGFGSFLWKCYRQWQTLPVDAVSQAPKPPSHVQRGSLLLPARGFHGAIRQVQEEWEGKGH